MPPAAAATPLPAHLAFGDFMLDLAAQQLSRSGQALHLPPRYFAVLVHLAGSGGRLVGKDELLDAVWGHRSVSDSALKVAINAVRAVLGEDPKAPRHLETVARRGYRFVGATARAATTPASPAETATADGAPITTAAAAVPAALAWPAVAAATAAAAFTPPGNLPAAAPGLIGREADLARLHAALAQHRLVTLHGPGGVGKTRLALSAAATDAPADGVWLLRLDTLDSAAPLLTTLARTLSLGAGAEARPEALARALAGQRLRLVLDNAEHLLSAVAELAAALLAAAPGVQLLVTSQVPLRLAAEHLLPLAPLALPAEGASPVRGEEAGTAPGVAAPAASAAVALLLQCARQHQSDLAFDSTAAADAEAICRALDGLPLALELAAARVPLLGWAGVRERLGQRLSLLTRGARGAAPRHQTLRAALAWAHELLSAPEQRVLQALSVLAGAFSVETAVAVAGGDSAQAAPSEDLIDILDSLRERSLLVRSAEAPNHASTPRWRLYDSVRAFAAEGLQASGEQGAVARRLVAHMTAVFQHADRLFGSTPQQPWLARLQAEVSNLRAAMQLALADPTLHSAALALFAASAQFRVRGGWRLEALQDHAALCALKLQAPTVLAQAAFDLAVAQLANMGQVLPPQQGLDAARCAAQAFRLAGENLQEYTALAMASGLLVRMQAEPAVRAALLERMRALEAPDWTRLQRRHRIWNETMLLREQGELEAFEAACLAYMAGGRAQGDLHSAWVATQGLAQALCAQDRTAPAIELLGQAVGEMREHGLLRENAHVLAQWAALRISQNAAPETVRALREAASLLRAEGRLWWMADALPWLPAWQGRWDDAARVQAWADDLVRQRGERRGQLFGALRQRWGERLAEQADAASHQRWLNPNPQQPQALDEGAVMLMTFGPEPLPPSERSDRSA